MNALSRTVVILCALVASAHAHAQDVVEYVNTGDFLRSPGGQFFYSADPGEQKFVDGGGAGQFKRTGNGFRAGGPTPACRFYGSVAPGPNSHFYTVDAGECEALRAAQVKPTPAGAQQWNYEGNGYSVSAPTVAGDGSKSCPVGTQPVYRAYNNAFPTSGAKNPWDSNHRYSTYRADIQFLLKNENWRDEGIVLCSIGATPQPTLPRSDTVAKRCVAPRADVKYGDKPGMTENEQAWIRSFIDERYLWLDDVPNTSPAIYFDNVRYFNALRTPFITASGKDKDRYSFALSTTEWEGFDTGDAGVGYGLDLAFISASAPRNIVVRQVEPGSPAANAGVRRGMRLQDIDGTSVINGNANVLNAAISPRAAGQSHQFTFSDLVTGASTTVTLVAAQITTVPVPKTKVLDTATGPVGYVVFNDFALPSEGQLATAFQQLSAAKVKDLVLDLRYNGGGYGFIAAELAYMIAGTRTAGKVFSKDTYNRKRVDETNDPDSTTPFYNLASGYDGSGTQANAPLPTLNLNRVYVIGTEDTASASELVINGLRGIDVEVVLIGTTTFGKPYGFVPEDNCGITYLAVEIQSANAKGVTDYTEGFKPTCTVADDDLARELGDTAETRLAAALAHRATGACPAGTAATDAAKSASATPVQVLRTPRMFGNVMLPRAVDKVRKAAMQQSLLQR
jgi:carboxyl-terminal processing protease